MNNVFVTVTGVERKDTVEEIVPNTSQQREQIDMWLYILVVGPIINTQVLCSGPETKGFHI